MTEAAPRAHEPGQYKRERLAAWAIERALVSALIAVRHLGLYEWSQNLNVATELENRVGDCFPTQQFHDKDARDR
ncbi:hypothetical protein [Actinomadura litoris]|uniref:Uncharacterized protein n=1 Tax=Actinomadura litoris TaxID=2678616 RepID=A0A7K1L4U4_9ACTN|nr:hypothetical protein [Actinomadura litoris]MUN39441.1 hypothetical protein [Actinomadura litoris]